MHVYIYIYIYNYIIYSNRGGSRIDCRGGAKYTARVSAREILCPTPTFDVISATTCYTKKK